MSIRRMACIAAGVLVIFVCAVAVSAYFRQAAHERDKFQQVVNSTLVNFDVNWIAKPDGSQQALGGGLARHADGVFAGQKAENGEVYFLSRDDNTLRATGARLPPSNRSRIPDETQSGNAIDRNLLRYNDLAVQERDGIEYLLASYSYFNVDGQCFVGRLAETALPDGWLARIRDGADVGFGDWQVVYETEPCLPIIDNAGYPFTGHQAGGRIAVDGGDVYLTVGDYAFDALEGKLPPHPQLADTSYGKVVRLTPVESGPWAHENIAIGMRNPQGIAIDDKGRLWEVEHAAMGGDELNLIERGGNYGWPEVTLGVDYTDIASDKKGWPFNERQGFHPGYEKPVFAWVPSIAPSNVKVIRDVSPRWDGDLLVGALKDQSLVRLRLNDDSVVFAEKIELNRRVRYVEIAHGRIYVLFDYGALAILTPREMRSAYVDFDPMLQRTYDPAAARASTATDGGSVLARSGCIECHSGTSMPDLARVFGEPIAAQDGVDYSDALRAREGIWDESNLRAFLADAQEFAPGTTMPDRELSDMRIDAILAALRDASDHGM